MNQNLLLHQSDKICSSHNCTVFVVHITYFATSSNPHQPSMFERYTHVCGNKTDIIFLNCEINALWVDCLTKQYNCCLANAQNAGTRLAHKASTSLLCTYPFGREGGKVLLSAGVTYTSLICHRTKHMFHKPNPGNKFVHMRFLDGLPRKNPFPKPLLESSVYKTPLSSGRGTRGGERYGDIF